MPLRGPWTILLFLDGSIRGQNDQRLHRVLGRSKTFDRGRQSLFAAATADAAAKRRLVAKCAADHVESSLDAIFHCALWVARLRNCSICLVRTSQHDYFPRRPHPLASLRRRATEILVGSGRRCNLCPTYLALFLGQIGALILLGLIIFLYSDRRAWITAGLGLSLVSVKPHLLYLFWLALVFWMLRERRWRFVGGWLVGSFVTGAAPLFFNPSVYSQYLALVKGGDVIRPFDWALANIGSALGVFFSIAGGWIIGCRRSRVRSG